MTAHMYATVNDINSKQPHQGVITNFELFDNIYIP